MSKYRVISGPYFPVFSLNAGKYGPEINPYLDTFHVVNVDLGLVIWVAELLYSVIFQVLTLLNNGRCV